MVVRRDEELMKWAVGRRVDTFSYGSLGAGILTGAFRQEPHFESPRDPRNYFYRFFKEPFFGKVMKVVEVLDEISAEVGRPNCQVALNWQTQKNYVSTALCGVRNAVEANMNCAAFDWMLTDDQIRRIDEAAQKYIDFDATDRNLLKKD